MNMLETLQNLLNDSGFVSFFADGGWKNLVMIAVSCLLLYLYFVTLHYFFPPFHMLRAVSYKGSPGGDQAPPIPVPSHHPCTITI